MTRDDQQNSGKVSTLQGQDSRKAAKGGVAPSRKAAKGGVAPSRKGAKEGSRKGSKRLGFQETIEMRHNKNRENDPLRLGVFARHPFAAWRLCARSLVRGPEC